MRPKQCRFVGLAAGLLFAMLVAPDAIAIPSPIEHYHTVKSVHWKEPGSPPLPWNKPTSDGWNHNHLTADPFNNAPKWIINKAWDDRTLHSSLSIPAQLEFGHGLIRRGMEPRYGFTNTVPDAAKGVVKSAFDNWVTSATVQFNANRKPDDRLAIGFRCVNDADKTCLKEAGGRDITINFQEGLEEARNAYAVTQGTTITFETTPIVYFGMVDLNEIFGLGIADTTGWQMSSDNGATWVTTFHYDTPWSFDGTPGDILVDVDIDFRDPANNVFESIAGLDKITATEIDFTTIAVHEIGHEIALGHPGDPTGSIMREWIFRDAIFGRTRGIDADSALAVAIDYTFAVPLPPTLLLFGFGLFAIAGAGSAARRCERYGTGGA